MNRRRFLGNLTASAAIGMGIRTAPRRALSQGIDPGELSADLIIAGGGLGGCAAALAALRNGLRVILTEETAWVGGQLTSQGVPPDEHRWIESHGCTDSYQAVRRAIRDYYRRHYPLTESARAREHLNPGDGAVSRLCHEPRVAVAVLEAFFAPYLSNRSLRLLLAHKVVGAEVASDTVRSLKVQDLRGGRELVLRAPHFIDATELGDLLPLTGAEFVTGAESRKETGERHAAEKADPANQQAFTICFAIDHLEGEEHVIEKPREYDFWRSYVPTLSPPWPGRLLDWTYTHPSTGQPRALGFNPNGPTPGAFNLWLYRRLINRTNFVPGTYRGDISLINWPQNDYLLGNLVGVTEEEQTRHIERARQLSLSLLYWLQTEAPRPDGKQGWPGLRLRGDQLEGPRGLAKYPYVREGRRIRAEFTILEEHVGREMRMEITGKPAAEVTAKEFPDTVGIGSYAIDLHPTSAGDNYIDFPSLPFQIPLGALLPVRVRNLLPACKNIGATHVTNGCYRLHPVEWNIGEAAGLLVAFANRRDLPLRAVRETPARLAEFQNWIRRQGVPTHWPA